MLYVHRNHKAYWGREKEGGRGEGRRGGGGRHEQLVSALRPVKTEETVSHRQNNKVKEVGTPPAPSNLCASLIAVSTAVRSKVTKTMSEKQLLWNNWSKGLSDTRADYTQTERKGSWKSANQNVVVCSTNQSEARWGCGVTAQPSALAIIRGPDHMPERFCWWWPTAEVLRGKPANWIIRFYRQVSRLGSVRASLQGNAVASKTACNVLTVGFQISVKDPPLLCPFWGAVGLAVS